MTCRHSLSVLAVAAVVCLPSTRVLARQTDQVMGTWLLVRAGTSSTLTTLPTLPLRLRLERDIDGVTITQWQIAFEKDTRRAALIQTAATSYPYKRNFISSRYRAEWQSGVLTTKAIDGQDTTTYRLLPEGLLVVSTCPLDGPNDNCRSWYVRDVSERPVMRAGLD